MNKGISLESASQIMREAMREGSNVIRSGTSYRAV